MASITPKRTLVLTHEDVIRHNKDGDGLWIILDQAVLDVQEFQFRHPGGRLVLQRHAPRRNNKAIGHNDHIDASEAFRRAGHGPKARQMLATLQVGVLTEEDTAKQQRASHQSLNHHQQQQQHAFSSSSLLPSEWAKFVVFVLNILPTVATFVSYWYLICNRNNNDGDGRDVIPTVGHLFHEIFTKVYLPNQLGLALGFIADYVLIPDCRTNFHRLEQAGFSKGIRLCLHVRGVLWFPSHIGAPLLALCTRCSLYKIPLRIGTGD